MKMPFVYQDDPDDSDNVPRANDLGYVEVADVDVLDGDERVGFFEPAWADDAGTCRAWLVTGADNMVHVEDYA